MALPSSSILIYFEGGPWNNKAYYSKDIFGGAEVPPEADLYQDGLRFKRSPNYPDLLARVWVLKRQPEPLTMAPASDALPTPRTDLSQRREALKVSRQTVAERSGLAVSKVKAIEDGTGKRIQPDEVTALEDALTAIEQKTAGRTD